MILQYQAGSCFYMDYLLITDFQKLFLYNESPLKLYNFFHSAVLFLF